MIKLKSEKDLESMRIACKITGDTLKYIQTLIKLADYYHVTLDYLVGRQFANDVGFLTKDQHKFISMYLKLNERYQERINGRIESLYAEQNME